MKQLKLYSLGLVSAFALLAASPAAHAADVYQGEPSIKDSGPVDYAPPITWTGFYIGANAGAAWEDDDDFADDSVFIGGAHLGYNWQTPRNIVIGVEADLGFVEGIDYLATIRGRLGYSFGPALLYATGGVAFAEFENDLAADVLDETGWVAGGGLEYKIRDNWSLGAEGLYHSFEADDGFSDFDFWVARARLTYHFGGVRDVLK